MMCFLNFFSSDVYWDQYIVFAISKDNKRLSTVFFIIILTSLNKSLLLNEIASKQLQAQAHNGREK